MSEINDTEEVPEDTLPINLKLKEQHQRKYPSLRAKYKQGTYYVGSFRRGSYKYINLITCEDNIVTLAILQSCVLHWYRMYLLHPGMD